MMTLFFIGLNTPFSAEQDESVISVNSVGNSFSGEPTYSGEKVDADKEICMERLKGLCNNQDGVLINRAHFVVSLVAYKTSLLSTNLEDSTSRTECFQICKL